MRRKFGFGLLLVITLLFTQLSTALAEDKPSYGTTENHDKYTRWGDQFWEYAATLTSPSLPPNDYYNQFFSSTSGECVYTNQNYEVFFLAGVGGSGAVNRICTIQAGTRLFFPLVNTAWLEDPKYYDPKASPPYGPKTFIGWFDKYFSRSNVADLVASIDGKDLIKADDLEDLYVSSKPGSAPILNWFGASYQTFNGGYYLSVKLPPRSKPYTLHFGGKVTKPQIFTTHFSKGSNGYNDPNYGPNYTVEFSTITQDITYKITVKA
jgi:hypothetical protein